MPIILEEYSALREERCGKPVLAPEVMDRDPNIREKIIAFFFTLPEDMQDDFLARLARLNYLLVSEKRGIDPLRQRSKIIGIDDVLNENKNLDNFLGEICLGEIEINGSKYKIYRQYARSCTSGNMELYFMLLNSGCQVVSSEFNFIVFKWAINSSADYFTNTHRKIHKDFKGLGLSELFLSLSEDFFKLNNINKIGFRLGLGGLEPLCWALVHGFKIRQNYHFNNAPNDNPNLARCIALKALLDGWKGGNQYHEFLSYKHRIPYDIILEKDLQPST